MKTNKAVVNKQGKEQGLMTALKTLAIELFPKEAITQASKV